MGTEANDRHIGDHLYGISQRFRVSDLEKEIERLTADNDRLRDELARRTLERDLAESRLKLVEANHEPR
jgi:hypothetical protein